MPVNKSVMPSGRGTLTQQHYKNFTMIIDIFIPSRTTRKDYLKHPLCDASRVADLVKRGESINGISQTLGVSKYILQQVVNALGGYAHLSPPIDPLHHPKIDIEAVKQLIAEGYAIRSIAERLHSSHNTIRKVIVALQAEDPQFSFLCSRKKPNLRAC